ncbi:hypothetical protein DV738_g1554, partial [Chaetothyriales sp. CBS 135597]
MPVATQDIAPHLRVKLGKNEKLQPERVRFMQACQDIANALIQEFEALHDDSKPKKDINLNSLRGQMAKRHRLSTQPSLTAILAAVPENYKKAVSQKLIAKPIRTASGISVVAVMSKPHRCPHIAYTGNVCVYCPGGPDSDFEYSTQSYTGYEPTSMRAIRARYDPFEQARGRVDQIKSLGHSVDKVEFIVMGGTFMSLPKEYRESFIAQLHNALSGYQTDNVDEAVAAGEMSNIKCVGITIETRPDYCLDTHLSDMLRYGCTRLEVGVQSLYEDVARDTNRGHTVAAVVDTFKLSKDAGFKVVSHMMPDLPNVGMERDIFQFEEYFDNPNFRTDGLKIYPTLVIRGTGLYELWRTGRYKNYTPNALVDLVARILALIPPWTRIYRVQRDIPMPLVTSGVENGNLRELALSRMKDFGTTCRDVRTREVGINEVKNKIRPSQIELVRRDYMANGGWETFLAYEDPKQDILIGLLRLRKCSPTHTFRPELTGQQTSLVRELHVYGLAVPIHGRDKAKFQHQGYGSLLMREAERIARDEHGSAKLSVISGVGVRSYYERLGFYLDARDCTNHVHLIVGSGPLAAARCARSLEVGARPVLIAAAAEEGGEDLHYSLAKSIDEGLVHWTRCAFQDSDLTTRGRAEVDSYVDAVFVALSRSEKQQSAHISTLCKRLRIPVNVVDAPALCTFTLLSTYSDGPLQIGITTSGRGGTLSSRIRREIAASLPRDFGRAIDRLGGLRRRIWQEDISFNALVKEDDRSPETTRTRRMRWLSQICEYWPLARLAAITDEDVSVILDAYRSNSSSGEAENGKTNNITNAIANASEIDAQQHALSTLNLTPAKGSISLVGSGPGHPSLLTMAAHKAIKSADFILADKLVPAEVLALIPRRTPVHIARKFPGNADAAQEEMLGLALAALKEGKQVLRLKQGDPYLYGRGAEEVAFFRTHGFTAVVVPGVTSALSAPLFAEIPVTHRAVAEEVLVCTGTGRKGAAPVPPGFKKGRTAVFLMALHRLESLDTPCAVIERASCPDQRVIRSTLQHVYQAVQEEGSRPPGLLVVGRACEVLHKLEAGKRWTTEEGFRALDGLSMAESGLQTRDKEGGDSGHPNGLNGTQ